MARFSLVAAHKLLINPNPPSSKYGDLARGHPTEIALLDRAAEQAHYVAGGRLAAELASAQ
jgi:hypothetical protein